MKKWEKRAMAWGLALALAGVAIFIGLLAVFGFDVQHFAATVSDERYVAQEYRPQGDFTRVEISEESADVTILPSVDGGCSVSCDETDAVTYDVQVRDGTLVVTRQDERKGSFVGWFSVNLCTPKVTICLPADAYEAIRAETVSGGVNIRGLEIGDVEISTTSGNIRLQETQLGSLHAETVSGETCLTDGDASGTVRVSSVSGNVELENFDAAAFEIASTSGDIKGTLKTGKDFEISTISGSVDCPENLQAGGSFRAETVSGDVRLAVK